MQQYEYIFKYKVYVKCNDRDIRYLQYQCTVSTRPKNILP